MLLAVLSVGCWSKQAGPSSPLPLVVLEFEDLVNSVISLF